MSALGDYVLGGLTLTPVSDIHLVIAGAEASGYLRTQSAVVTFALSERATFNFELVDKTNTYEPVVGSDVKFYIGDSLLFGGSIERITRGLETGTTLNSMRVECVDYAQILDRRLVAATYEVAGQTAGDIVRDIISDLSDEGLLPGEISDGVEIEKAVFPYVTATTAINDLAEISGMVWWVDQGKRVHFYERASSAAPFSITDASSPFKGMTVTPSRERLKNHIFLLAGKTQTDPQEELFAGDGKRLTFSVGFPIYSEPTVSVSIGGGPYTEKTVGIRGVETGKDWYWSKEDNTLLQDGAGTRLTALDTLKVVYVGMFPLVLESFETGSIADQKAIEGSGTGYYDALEEDANIDSRELAVAKLQTLLREFSVIEDELKFSTFSRGMAIGQTITVNLTDEKVNDEFLITRVRHSLNLSANGALITAQVEATSGEYLGGWVYFWRNLEKRGRKFSIRENETLALGPTKFDRFSITDTANSTDPLEDGSGDPYTGAIIWANGDDDEVKQAVGNAADLTEASAKVGANAF